MSDDVQLIAVDDIIYDFRPRPWAFARDAAADIDAHWAELRAQNAGLFDGQVLIATHWAITARDGRTLLEAACTPCAYKAFLAWRDFGFPDRQVWNLFAMAALQSADAAFLVGCMSTQTANPGRVYFPAGTPDLQDVRGAGVDLVGSVTRELAEETGIVPADVALMPGWTIVVDGQRIACMKEVRSRLAAAELVRDFETFRAAQHAPELQGLEAVRPTRDLDDSRMPSFMLHYLRSMAYGIGPDHSSIPMR